MKKVYLSLILIMALVACQKGETEDISLEKTSQKHYSVIPEGITIEEYTPVLTYDPNSSEWTNNLKSASTVSEVKLGIWIPYFGGNGVPPLQTLLDHEIDAEFITGDIDANILDNFDVIFMGRTGIFNNDLDINALEQWVSAGGGIIGEGNAFLSETDKSEELSKIAGVSAKDINGSTPSFQHQITLTNPLHPVAKDVLYSFEVLRPMIVETDSYVDGDKNKSATEVASVYLIGSDMNAPIVASEYSSGKSVYFPFAVSISNWEIQNPEYLKLFINAVKWCGTPASSPPIQVAIDIKPDDYPNVINLASKGKLPVAIYGSEEFDCSQIDLASVLLEGMPVSFNEKNGKYQAHLSDINADGMDDLLVQFEISGNELSATSDIATISGTLSDGSFFEGSDDILVINNKKSK